MNHGRVGFLEESEQALSNLRLSGFWYQTELLVLTGNNKAGRDLQLTAPFSLEFAARDDRCE